MIYGLDTRACMMYHMSHTRECFTSGKPEKKRTEGGVLCQESMTQRKGLCPSL